MNQPNESAFAERNPFMLLMHPEVVLAAVEKSERLNRLNRHMCRPLDRPVPGTEAAEAAETVEAVEAAEGAATAQAANDACA
jgi:hypothetical protein